MPGRIGGICVSSPNMLAQAVRSRGTVTQKMSSWRWGTYQLKLMPHEAAGARGSRSWESGIAISTDQPSERIDACARQTVFHDESRADSESSVWIQSARTPRAVTPKL
jgi:hypothetical protein